MGKKKTRAPPNPFEWIAPLHFAEKVEIAVACLFLLPLLRFLATVFFAGMGALWCQFIFITFSFFGREPSKQAPAVRRLRVALLRYPCMVIQRMWLFSIGFWWIDVTGHDVFLGVWWGKHPKLVVANHTSFIDMLIMVWQHNPTFLGKRAILNIPLIGTVGFVNEMIAVDREDIVSAPKSQAGGQAASAGGNAPKDSTPTAPPPPAKALSTKERIVAHVSDPNAPTMVVFPEGTTCRNDALLQFKAGGAFAHPLPVQPMVLRYNNKTWLPWPDTFEYANTPATNTKQWAFRFLCRFRHSLTVTYLPPITPTSDNGLLGNPVAFANQTRDAIASVMTSQQEQQRRQQRVQVSRLGSQAWARHRRAGLLLPPVSVTEQSYEEFFLFKVACEECKLPGSVLRCLDFKRAKRAVASAREVLQRQSAAKQAKLSKLKRTASGKQLIVLGSNGDDISTLDASGGGSASSGGGGEGGGGGGAAASPVKTGAPAAFGSEGLTLEGSKATLRAFALCLKCQADAEDTAQKQAARTEAALKALNLVHGALVGSEEGGGEKKDTAEAAEARREQVDEGLAGGSVTEGTELTTTEGEDELKGGGRKAARDLQLRVSEAAIGLGLGLEPNSPALMTVWAALGKALAATPDTSANSDMATGTVSDSKDEEDEEGDGEGDGEEEPKTAVSSLNFQDFLIALHAARPQKAVDAGWLSDFGAKKKN